MGSYFTVKKGLQMPWRNSFHRTNYPWREKHHDYHCYQGCCYGFFPPEMPNKNIKVYNIGYILFNYHWSICWPNKVVAKNFFTDLSVSKIFWRLLYLMSRMLCVKIFKSSDVHFLHDRPWISPWIKSISNELWRHQQSIVTSSSAEQKPSEWDTGTMRKECRFIDFSWRVRNKNNVCTLVTYCFCVHSNDILVFISKHQNNPLVNAERVRNSSTFINLSITIPMYLYFCRSLRLQHRIRLHINLFLSFIFSCFIFILWDILVYYDRLVTTTTESRMHGNSVSAVTDTVKPLISDVL